MIISSDKVTKIFGEDTTKVIAVNNVSLQIEKGQFVAITGKSGSGKSTLLYLLGLLDTPTSGSVKFEDKLIVNQTEKALRKIRLNGIGYVFQDYSLMPSLTAKQNVVLPLLMQGETILSANKIAEKALDQVELSKRYDYTPSKLSGGEKQRVGIARAVAKKPSLIIADEPTANLDSKTSKQIMDLFIDLNKKGQTIIMVTHELSYAKLANNRYRMKDGSFI